MLAEETEESIGPVNIDSSLFIARSGVSGCTFTYTLVTRLGEILRIAEERYGPRDKEHTILGIEFVVGVSQIWFPGDCMNIAIQLGVECMYDRSQALFQLAHEAIHLLSPIHEAEEVTVLEEGLATLFACEYSKIVSPEDWKRPSSLNYQDAMEKVQALVAIYPMAILELRERQPASTISWIKAADIEALYPDIEPEFAETLTQQFPNEERGLSRTR